MGSNLWIGAPGSLYEIDQATTSFDRSADLGVSEFKSLGGLVTVTRTASTTRRTKLSWDRLPPADARALDRLARRIDGPGPLVLIDPVAGNVLGAAQAAGRGVAGAGDVSGLDQWFKVSATGAVVEVAGAPGTFAFTAADATSKLGWRCVPWQGNFPVAAGTRISFRAPSAIAALGTVGVNIDFKKADGSYLSGPSATGPYVAATVPAGAVFATPCATPGTAGTYSLAGACLSYDDGAAHTIPGDGLPQLAVTTYTDTPGLPLPYRSINLELVEVSRATS
ncbi:hypothetical protein [Streptomyces endophyticus]|uniref:Phage tail protein n=1 Tax=Streptomyces endophyticus TaxID=714166 RepID=A0ABU6FJ49_9ACTN|nr:hypothetical protein [Streptomyces endophyticus]MEB8344081.1 hypothetical protein [Streptomyces endophyticus]